MKSKSDLVDDEYFEILRETIERAFDKINARIDRTYEILAKYPKNEK